MKFYQTIRVMQNSNKTSGKHGFIFRLKIILLFCCLAIVTTFGQKAIPELWGLHVHDDAKVLNQETVDKLEARLKLFEDSTSNQLAILTINSLDGDVLEEYSLRVAEKWELGQKDKDNGVLLLIAVEDHKMRIEVGVGLEGVLTDAISSRIIRNELAPYFRKDDYDGGVTAGVDAIISAIGGEYSGSDPQDDLVNGLSWKEQLLIGSFIFGILGIFTLLGLFVSGCGGWFLYAFLIPFYAAFPLFVLGVDKGLAVLGTYVIGFPILKLIIGQTPWGKRVIKKMGTGSRSSGGGWSSGSGWSGSSSSSSGGFSGGGGSFGGGGSSGGW
jgi:uncharacterized protein